MADRWRCTAVLLKSGCPGRDRPVREPQNPARVAGASRGVRLAELGTLAGRLHLRDAAWFEQNVEKVYIGARVCVNVKVGVTRCFKTGVKSPGLASVKMGSAVRLPCSCEAR